MNTNIVLKLFFLFLGILFCFCTSRVSAGPASVDFKPEYDGPPDNAPGELRAASNIVQAAKSQVALIQTALMKDRIKSEQGGKSYEKVHL
jgi:hypothetical protein